MSDSLMIDIFAWQGFKFHTKEHNLSVLKFETPVLSNADLAAESRYLLIIRLYKSLPLKWSYQPWTQVDWPWRTFFIFSCDSSPIGHNVGLSVCRLVCLSVGNEFYGSVMLLVVHICCYSCCSLGYQNILLSYFAFLAAEAAPQVKMSVCNKFYTSCKAATSLCMM